MKRPNEWDHKYWKLVDGKYVFQQDILDADFQKFRDIELRGSASSPSSIREA